VTAKLGAARLGALRLASVNGYVASRPSGHAFAQVGQDTAASSEAETEATAEDTHT
jgi:hypothetical protein